MTGCHDRREEILRHAAGELSEAEADPLRAHLRGCRDCRAGFESARALEALLRSPSLEMPGAGFRARVLTAVEGIERERLSSRVREISRARRRPVSRGDLLPAVLLAAAALVAGLLFLPAAATLEPMLSAAATSVPGGEWVRFGMTLLGARGETINPTYLYPPIVLVSLGLGPALVRLSGRRWGASTLQIR